MSHDTEFRRSRALAAAARSRGLAAPQDERLAQARKRLAALDTREAETATATDTRRALVTIEREIERLRDRVATLRGQVRACKEFDDSEEVVASFRDVAGALADAETRKIAAEQTLDRHERDLRAVRDRREQRLRLEDRVTNAASAARAHLAAALEDQFVDAIADLPDHEPPTDTDTVGSTTAALATARIAVVRAPIALACDRFASARVATAWLDAPVIWV